MAPGRSNRSLFLQDSHLKQVNYNLKWTSRSSHTPIPNPSHLAREDRRPRVLIRGRHGVVDVDLDAGVRLGVRAGDGNLVAGLGAAAARDGELRARDVELDAAGRAGRVQGDVLAAEEVLAGGDARGDLDVEGRLAFYELAHRAHISDQRIEESKLTIAIPRQGTPEVGLLMVDLEPHIARPVKLVNRLPIGDLGHVKLHGARVEDGGDRSPRDRVAGGDAVGAARGRVRRLEARHLLGVDAVGDEAVALVVVGAADILPVGRAVDGGEDV